MTKQVNIEPTGNPLDLEDNEHCSVVMTTETMKIKVEGKFRQRERKLFVLLVHSVWDAIGIERKHTVDTEKIKQVFHDVAGVKGFSNWLWDYLENLADLKVTYEDSRYKGITRLFSEVKLDKENGAVTFQIPDTIEEAIKSPSQFARLDTYFLIGLKGKYSVSLYQLLESKINLRKFNPKHTPYEAERFVEIGLEELKDWLAIGNQYKQWIHFRDRVLTPAVEEINSNPLATTFTVRTEEVRGSRSKVMAIKFFLKKTSERLKLESSIQTSKLAKRVASKSLVVPPFSGTLVYERAKKLVPRGLDVHALEEEWREYSFQRNEVVKNPEGAFLKWLEKKFSYQRAS